MMLEIQVLSLDRQQDLAVLSWLMGTQPSYRYKQNYIIFTIDNTTDKIRLENL